MPYRKTYRRPKRRYNRGRKLNYRQKKEVKRLVHVQQELKFWDVSTNAYGIDNSGVTFTLSAVPQGDSDSHRDGDRLYIRKMYVRGQIEFGDSTNIVRLIFYQWKPSTTPILGSILLNGPSGSIDVHSQYSHDYRQQFKILYDKTFVIIGNSSSATSPYTPVSIRQFQFTLRRLNHQMQFIGGGTAGTNQIYYLAISDSAAPSHPALTMSTKLMYTDS